MNDITIIVPCYNEKVEILQATVTNIHQSLSKTDVNYEIIIVDDSSDISYENLHIENSSIISHQKNKGYGAALKTGIKKAKYDWIGITDADGTYPNSKFHELLAEVGDNDMVIGARAWNDISWVRRTPKRILTIFSSFLSGSDIPDLNSGMRIFNKKLAYSFWHLFPNGFSFTSTLTIGAITNEYDVKFHPIEYYKRVGQSSINPIKDTIRFFTLVTRLALYFNPKKFFVPLSIIFLIIGVARGTRDYIVEGSFGGLTLILVFMAFQIFFFGLLAEIINKTRKYLSSEKFE